MATREELSVEQRRREDELVRSHLPLLGYAVAEMVAKVPRHVGRAELESAAMEGLALAARAFDPGRGIPFDRYASMRIKGALLDELRRMDFASRTARTRARTVQTAEQQLSSTLGRQPTEVELAGAAGMDVSTLRAVQHDEHRSTVLNFDGMTADGEVDRFLPVDGDTPDSVILDRERKAYLVDAIAALPERLRKVVIGYFIEERLMEDLAQELGVTDSRISQMRAEAMVLLRDGINSQLDPELLPAATSNRVAKQRAAFYASISSASVYRDRISRRPLAGAAT